jgi:hypothetical protein
LSKPRREQAEVLPGTAVILTLADSPEAASFRSAQAVIHNNSSLCDGCADDIPRFHGRFFWNAAFAGIGSFAAYCPDQLATPRNPMLQAGPVGGSPLLRRAAVRQFLPVLARRSFRRAAFSDSGKHVALSVGAASNLSMT